MPAMIRTVDRITLCFCVRYRCCFVFFDGSSVLKGRTQRYCLYVSHISEEKEAQAQHILRVVRHAEVCQP